MSTKDWGDFDLDVPLPTDLRSTTKYPWDEFPLPKNGNLPSMIFYLMTMVLIQRND